MILVINLILILKDQYCKKYQRMQAENPCPRHQSNSISSVCLSKDCQFSHVFCNSCNQHHYSHHVIPYKQFEDKYKSFQQIVEISIKKIRQEFTKVRQTFAVCIKRTEERIIKEIVSTSPIPKLQQLEIQQRYGIISNIIQNETFLKLIDESISFEDYQGFQTKTSQDLTTHVDQMNVSIMASINKFMVQLKTNLDNKHFLKNINVALPPKFFKFSQKYKPKDYQISENGACVKRSTLTNQGLSMYCVVEQPLSKQNNSICFKITNQSQRFIYFGVCDNETFKDFSFKGNLYMKGNKMYAIRQSSKQGGHAVTLHNSIQQYSNKDKVPWDFVVEDIITLKYNQIKNTLTFSKNGNKEFQMPLDKAISKFYPFVGLKYLGDTVKIMSQEPKKKGFFSNLFQNTS